MKIYTRKGDKGQTLFFDGKKVSKADLRIEVLGEIDELNSVIGIIISQIQSSKFKVQSQRLKLKNELVNIQLDLFEIGSKLNTKYQIPNTKYLENRILGFEKIIDDLSQKLPEIHNFILPVGGEVGSFLHLARSVCRRVERGVVMLSKKHPPVGGQEKIDLEVLKYFNRLSDLLFILARFANYKEKQKEIIWNKK